MNIVSNQKITEMATVTWSFPPWANAALSPVVYSLTSASGKAGSTQSPRDQVSALRADEEAWALASTSLPVFIPSRMFWKNLHSQSLQVSTLLPPSHPPGSCLNSTVKIPVLGARVGL